MAKHHRAADRKPKPKPLRKCPKVIRNGSSNDLFSWLNDDIIVSHILPRLPLEERVRTSLLSRRWKNLWSQTIGDKLIFSKTYDYTTFIQKDVVHRYSREFARGITHVMESYPKPTLDELTVNCDLDSRDSGAIDTWVMHALKKRVTRLGLNFLPYVPLSSKKNYTFPGMDKLLAWLATCDDHLHHQPAIMNCAGLYHLRDVSLKFVNVPAEIIEFMLCNCPSLERLCVWKSSLQQKISVSIQSSKLKSLEFVRCDYTKIKISSPSLVSFTFRGYRWLRLKNVPLLSELSLGGQCCRLFLKRPSLSSIYAPQLTRLMLDIDSMTVTESITFSLEFPELVKLKQLEITFLSHVDSSLLWPITLLKAAPMLEKVSFEEALETPTPCALKYQKVIVNTESLLKTMDRSKVSYTYCTRNIQNDDFRRNILIAIEQIHHRSLKLIEIHGFKGKPMEIELGQYLLGISEALEKFVVAAPNNFWKDALVFKRWLPRNAKFMMREFIFRPRYCC